MSDHPTTTTTNLPRSLSSALIPSAPPSTYYLPTFLTATEQHHLLQKVNTLSIFHPNPPTLSESDTASNIQINSVPLPQWRHLSHRRLQAHPSPLTPGNTLLSAPLPQWLQGPIIHRLLSIPLCEEKSEEHVFSDAPHCTPNHCLINEYTPGQGIHPHEDGGAYYPIVATVSLGAPIVLDVYRKASASSSPGDAVDTGGRNKPAYRILQEPGSLLLSMGEMYTDYLHGIAEVEADEGLHGREGGVVNWDLLSEGWKGRFEEADGRWGRETRVSLTFRDVIKVKSLGKGLGFLSKGK
ncbi:MAG: hypothetical protein Q9202_000819 [Teloschistes flavicans]